MAPRLASSCTNASTFMRYCVVVAERGAAAPTLGISLRAITGVEQPDEAGARLNSVSPADPIESEGAGAPGVPTSFSKCISQYTVCAPAFRNEVGIGPPVVATIKPGLANTFRKGTVPSAKSNHTGAASGSPHGAAFATPGAASHKPAASAVKTNAPLIARRQ